MVLLALRNLARRPLRNGLAGMGLALGVGFLICLAAFGHGYQKALGREVEGMGLQMMLVPLGCPYDAAARVIKGNALETSLPEAALVEARKDAAVAVAAPFLLAALPHPSNGRADMWVGLDETALALKPWWRARAGDKWFTREDSVILGCDAAELEMRVPGDALFSPESGQKLQVAGILERSGTSDDNLFFVPLRTAQRMFHQPGRLTAIGIRLRDPAMAQEAGERLQQIPGAQVVTLTEMTGTFLNLLGSVRTLLLSLTVVVLVISVLSVLNTQLAALVERTNELAVMRALGASRWQIGWLMVLEGILLAAFGSLAGAVLAYVGGGAIERMAREFIPMAPKSLLVLTPAILAQSIALGIGAGLVAVIYPAWRGSRLRPTQALTLE